MSRSIKDQMNQAKWALGVGHYHEAHQCLAAVYNRLVDIMIEAPPKEVDYPRIDKSPTYQYPPLSIIPCEFCNRPATSINFYTNRFSCEDHWDLTYEEKKSPINHFDEWNW